METERATTEEGACFENIYVFHLKNKTGSTNHIECITTKRDIPVSIVLGYSRIAPMYQFDHE